MCRQSLIPLWIITEANLRESAVYSCHRAASQQLRSSKTRNLLTADPSYASIGVGRLQRAERPTSAGHVSTPAHPSLPQRSVLPIRSGEDDPVLPALGWAGQGGGGREERGGGREPGRAAFPAVAPPAPSPGLRATGRWRWTAGGRRTLSPPPAAPPRSPRRASRGGFSISFFSTSGNAPARPRRSCCAAPPALPPAAVGSGPPAAASCSAVRPGILPAGGRAVSGHRRRAAAAAPRQRQQQSAELTTQARPADARRVLQYS